MDLINELAELALATRLKRLSERLSNDVSKIYKEEEVDFEARWFLILTLLARTQTLSITEIADYLQLSHPAIVQLVQELTQRKLIKTTIDKQDGRKRMVSLSHTGKKTLQQIEPVLMSIREENKKWVDAASADILKLLTELELALDQQSMYQRVKLNILLKNQVTLGS